MAAGYAAKPQGYKMFMWKLLHALNRFSLFVATLLAQ